MRVTLLVGFLAIATGVVPGLMAQPKPRVVRWSNLIIVVQADRWIGVQMWIGASMAAREAGASRVVHASTVRPDDLEAWLPFARQFRAHPPEHLTPVLTTTQFERLALARDSAPAPGEPPFLFYVADSGGANPLVVRATGANVSALIEALEDAAGRAGWQPDSMGVLDQDPPCPGLGYNEAVCSPVIMLAGSRIAPPRAVLEGRRDGVGGVSR